MLVTSKKKYRKGRTREDRAAGWFGRSSSAGGRRRKMLRRMRARRRAVADTSRRRLRRENAAKPRGRRSRTKYRENNKTENWTVRAFLQLTPRLSNDLLLRDSLSLSRSFLLWLQPWSLSTIMLLWHSFLIIIIIKFGFSWTWCARATKSEAIRRSQLVGFSAASRQMLQICFKTPITSLESQKFSYVVGIRDRSVTRMSINPI